MESNSTQAKSSDTPPLKLLGNDSGIAVADVVIIDTRDPQAMAWARQLSGLAAKTVIWVDGIQANPGHTVVRRPVQWPILPILLARALEQDPATRVLPAQNLAVNAATAPIATSTRSILVVDDSLAVRAHLLSQLEKAGYLVDEAQCVQEAIEAVTRSTYACVLMDVLMPGIDGYEGCKHIKTRLRGRPNAPPIVMLTSKSSPFDRIHGKKAGCDVYLTKLVAPGELLAVLSKHVMQPAENSQSEVRAIPTAESNLLHSSKTVSA